MSIQTQVIQRLRPVVPCWRNSCRTGVRGHAAIGRARLFSGMANGSGEQPTTSTGVEWRKVQLDKLERKFTEPLVEVESDEDLQPMWQEMESRVTRRRPRTVKEMGGRTGRVNVKKTDEEMWLREGLYDADNANLDNAK